MSRPKIVPLLIASACGLAAAIAAAIIVPRAVETGRVNLIGPLPGTASVPVTGGETTSIEFTVTADIRRRAMFSAMSPYSECAAATVTITDPTDLPAGLDIASLNEAVATFVESETASHPGLIAITVPTFAAGAPLREASTGDVHYFWPALLRDAAGLAAIGLATGALTLLVIAAGRRTIDRRQHAPATSV
jgi:hypothetical protein